MHPHHWVIVGVVSLLLDLLIPMHKVFLGSGVGGSSMAALVCLPVPENLQFQLALFFVLSGIAVVAHYRMGALLRRGVPDEVVLLETVPSGAYGRAENAGRIHDVKNVGRSPLEVGSRYRVLNGTAVHLEVKRISAPQAVSEKDKS